MIITKKIKLFLLLLLPLSLTAQQTPPSIEWGAIYEYNLGGVLPWSDGNYLSQTPLYNEQPSTTYNHIIYNDSGVVVDTLQLQAHTDVYTFTNPNGSSSANIYITPTPDGGFIAMGALQGHINDADGNPVCTNNGTGSSNDVLLTKYDSNHNIEWVKNYGGSGADSAGKVLVTSDGGYLLVGHTTSQDGDLTGIKNYGTVKNWLILKTDSSGNLEWVKSYGTSTSTSILYQQTATQAVQTDDGYVVLGTIRSTTAENGDVVGANGGMDMWVLKLDNQGNNTGAGQWQKTLGGSNDDISVWGGGLKQLSDGSFLVLGGTKSADGDVSEYNGGSAYGDAWIVRLSESGQIIWDKTIGGVGDEIPSAPVITPDGHIVVGVRTYSSELTGFQPVPGQSQSGSTNMIITKINGNDSTGTTIWQKFLGVTGPAYENTVDYTYTTVGSIAGIFSKPDGRISIFANIHRQTPAEVGGEIEPVLPFTGPDVDTSFTSHNYTDSDEGLSGFGWRIELEACPLFTIAEPVAICEGGSYDFYGTEITDAGIYTHTIEGENCDEIVTLTVTVNPLPEFGVETPAVTICEGETTELTATAAEGVTVNWYATEEAAEILFTGNTYTTPELTETTSYWAEAVSEAECASARIEVVVTVNPRPELSVEAASVCEGNSTELTATVAEGVTVNWYATADATEVLHTGATFTTPPLNNSTTYYVEAVSSESCVSERLEVVVTVNPSPELTVAQTAIEACEGSPVVLTADVETGNMAIWYDSEEATQWIGTGEEFSIEDLEPGTYSYWAQAYNPQTHCVSERIEVSVTVLPAPVLEAETAYTICEGNDAALYAYSEGNVIFWYENQDDTEYLYHGNNFIIEGLAEGTHTYWVEAYTVETGCASERTEVTVTVNPVPDAPIVVEVYQAEPGQTLADLEEDIEAEGELTWYADAALTTELPNTTVVEDGAVYYVTQTVNGCESEAAAVNVEMLGTYDVNGSDFAYYPNPVRDKLNFTGSDKVESVQIYDLNGRLLLNQNGQDIRNVNVAQLSAGTYIVRAKAGKELKTFKIIKK